MVIHSVAVKIYYKFYLLTNEITLSHNYLYFLSVIKPEKVSPCSEERNCKETETTIKEQETEARIHEKAS